MLDRSAVLEAASASILCPRIRRSEAPSRSLPSNASRRAVTRAAFGVNFMTERPVSYLPDPDSPTMPTFSRPMAKGSLSGPMTYR